MSKIGVLKEMDSLGRLVIPKEMRERYGLCREVEIITTDEGILVCNPDYHLVPKKKGEVPSSPKKL